jgi:DNA-binding response OmpR family regulator
MTTPPESTLAEAKDGSVSAMEADDKRATVLLVEDDRSLRRYLEVVLARGGYDVLSAADGLEAMKITLASDVDLVVTDAMMPNLNGYEFGRFLRSSPKLSTIPIILLTALEQKEMGREASQFDALVTKPVSPQELVDCIGRLLREAQESRSNAAQ